MFSLKTLTTEDNRLESWLPLGYIDFFLKKIKNLIGPKRGINSDGFGKNSFKMVFNPSVNSKSKNTKVCESPGTSGKFM